MPISIKNDDAEQLVRRLSALTGESLTTAVTEALRERLSRVERQRRNAGLAAELDAIARRCAALPVLDPRPPDEIIGYDEHGMPR